MSNDTFALSIGQAQQLEFAFQRNSWTAADVHKLCSEYTLGRVLMWLDDQDGKLWYGIAYAFRDVGFTAEEIYMLAGPYDRVRCPHYIQSEYDWKEWRLKSLRSLMGMMRHSVTPVLNVDLETMKSAVRERNELENENRQLKRLLDARIERPLEEVFTQENCQNREYGTQRTRVLNLCRAENIKTLRDLITKNEYELLRIPDLGRKTLNLIKDVLADIGLHLGMEMPA